MCHCGRARKYAEQHGLLAGEEEQIGGLTPMALRAARVSRGCRWIGSPTPLSPRGSHRVLFDLALAT